MADGDIKLKTTVDTTPAKKTLDSLRGKIKDTFSGKSVGNFDNKVAQASENVRKLERELAEVKRKMGEITSGEVVPKSITDLEKELKKAEAELSKLDKQFEEMAAEQQSIAGSAITLPSGEQWLPPEAQARFEELDQQIIKNGQDTDVVTQKIETLRNKLNELQTNPQLTEEFQELSAKSDEISNKLDINKQKLEDIESSNIKSPFEDMSNSVKNVTKRIATLAKRVLIFSVITKVLNKLKDYMVSAAKANTGLANSFAQIKGNLSVAAQSIFSTLAPALQKIADILALVTARIAQFVAFLTGKSITASRDAAKALHDQANATKGAGDAAKEAEKSSLGFDELNTISSPKEDSGGGGANTPGFQTSDLTMTDEIEKKMQGILVLVSTIGGALLAWNIYNFVTQLMASEKALSLFKTGFGKVIGIAMILAGAILLIKGYLEAWVNGIDWGNFALILSGVALIIAGIALVVSPLAAAFVAVGAGIAFIILGVKDFLTNGPTFQNILTIIIGLLILLGAVWIIAGGPVAWIVAGVAALIAIFVILWNKCEGFRNFWIGLWEGIKQVVSDVWTGFLKPIIDAIIQTIMDLWNNTIKPVWENSIKPVLVEIGQKMQELWVNVIKPVFDKIGEICKWVWDNVLAPLVGFIKDLFIEKIKIHLDTLKNIFATIFETIGGIINSIKDIFSGIVDFIVGIFTGDMDKAMGGVKKVFSGWIDGISAIFKGFVNIGISIINGFISGINLAISAINLIPGVNIPAIPKIPKLAKGAVLPPNKPFMAMVGDQKHGTNIEAPLSTIEEAVENVLARKGMSGGNQPINIIAKGDVADLIRFLSFELENQATLQGRKLSSGGAY